MSAGGELDVSSTTLVGRADELEKSYNAETAEPAEKNA
jgi:hypothetical protein